MPTVSGTHWEAVKALLGSGQNVLWVTEGAQTDVTQPSKVMMHGLAGTVRVRFIRFTSRLERHLYHLAVSI